MVRQDSGSNFSLYPTAALSLLPILFLTLFLTACGSSESNVSSGNKSGTLHWGNGTEPQSLDPHIATGVPEHKIITALMEGLVAKDSKTLEPRPAVASSWDISEDGRLYTFYLRKDARWSNGDPHNAHDYVWSWWRALQPALGNLYAYMYFPIDNAREYYEGSITNFDQVGVKALDDHTLQVRLKNPTPTSCSCWITTACFRSIVLPLKSLAARTSAAHAGPTRATWWAMVPFSCRSGRSTVGWWLNATPTTGMQTMSA